VEPGGSCCDLRHLSASRALGLFQPLANPEAERRGSRDRAAILGEARGQGEQQSTEPGSFLGTSWEPCLKSSTPDRLPSGLSSSCRRVSAWHVPLSGPVRPSGAISQPAGYPCTPRAFQGPQNGFYGFRVSAVREHRHHDDVLRQHRHGGIIRMSDVPRCSLIRFWLRLL
jgi:hypothetical protein